MRPPWEHKKVPQNLTTRALFVEFPSMDSIIATGMAGIARGMESAARNAEEVTRSFQEGSSTDPVRAITSLEADRRQVEASAKVIQVGASLTKHILDLFA
jgi:flagellar basal body rod protein FlgG